MYCRDELFMRYNILYVHTDWQIDEDAEGRAGRLGIPWKVYITSVEVLW